MPGAAVALVPESAQAGGAGGWAGTCGKTQMAAWLAESAWHSGGVEVLAWVAARAGRRCCRATRRPPRGWAWASRVTARRPRPVSRRGWGRRRAPGWLSWTASVIPPTCEGLWPAGAAGRLIVTTAQPENAGAGRWCCRLASWRPVRPSRYLSDRLSADPDHRAGQMDLALELGGEPAALAHAAAVIETSELTCRDYQEIFQRHRAGLSSPAPGRSRRQRSPGGCRPATRRS